MRKNYMERFTGFTLGINPIFTVVGLLYMSIFKTRGVVSKLKSDRTNLFFWGLLAISGIFSIVFAYNRSIALSNYLIPFVFIWLYVLGRWVITDPETFIQDFIRGVTFLALVTVVADLFRISWSIGDFRIIAFFQWEFQRGEILYIADNSLGLLFQAGLVGAVGTLLLYWKDKKYIIQSLLALAACSWGIIITQSRGAMIGSLVGIFYLAIQYSIYALLGGSFLVAILSYFAGKRFLSTFDLSEHGTRINIWHTSLKILKDHFWFGIGQGNFGQVFEGYKPDAIKVNVTCSHSNYLNIFLGWGVIGGALFWGWHLFIFGRAFFRGLTRLQKIIIAILLSYFFHVAVNELFAAYSGFLLGLLDHPSFIREKEYSETLQLDA